MFPQTTEGSGDLLSTSFGVTEEILPLFVGEIESSQSMVTAADLNQPVFMTTIENGGCENVCDLRL
jgi:hypothetical protein